MSRLSLASEFPTVDQAAWRALVEKALRGADFDKTLVSHTRDGLRIEPLYTGSGTDTDAGLPGSAPYIRGLRTTPGERPWDIRQLHAFAEPAVVNTAILEDLEGGVSSITLQIAAPGQSGIRLSTAGDMATILDGVHLGYAGVSICAGANTIPAANMLQALWNKRGIAPDKAVGAFNADPLGVLAATGSLPVSLEDALAASAQLAQSTRDTYPNVTAILVDTAPYHNGGASEALELACLCATMVTYLRALEVTGIEPAQALEQIAFSISVDTDQFLSIAKLRAARALIARMAEACGAAEALARTTLHATTSARMLAASDPWVNILRTTMACSSAAMGGADSITVLPFTWILGQPDTHARRIARNIQIVLQEESSLGAVLDPAGGNWYVEALTSDLAGKAWELFQEIEAQGGMAQALQKGFVQKQISETAKAHASGVATGQNELTGVSSYPEIGDAPVSAEPHPVPIETESPAITAEPIPMRRPAEPFDAMRKAANDYSKRTGSRPAVFLANLGKIADFATRATYAENFFATGGIDAVSGDGFESADDAAEAFAGSGARLACICSSDDVYLAMAEDVAQTLSKTDALQIYLAGRPGDERPKLRKAGVGTFIHQGCDMVEILQNVHEYLGIQT